MASSTSQQHATSGNNNHLRRTRRKLFPEKLWDLVHNSETGVQWSLDGRRIEVERTQLEKFIGTKFRSQNFDSFIRQLHFYGFRKAGNSYYHEKFQQGRFEAMLTMKRKYSNSSNSPNLNMTSSIHSPTASSSASSSSVAYSLSSSAFSVKNNHRCYSSSAFLPATTPVAKLNQYQHHYLGPAIPISSNQPGKSVANRRSNDLTFLVGNRIVSIGKMICV